MEDADWNDGASEAKKNEESIVADILNTWGEAVSIRCPSMLIA